MGFAPWLYFVDILDRRHTAQRTYALLASISSWPCQPSPQSGWQRVEPQQAAPSLCDQSRNFMSCIVAGKILRYRSIFSHTTRKVGIQWPAPPTNSP